MIRSMFNPAGDDQRKFKRAHLIYYLRVFNRETDQMIGHLVNITPDGIMLVSEEPIEPGIKFQMRMLFKSSIENKDHIDFEAESLWSSNDINPDFFDTGFTLTRIDEADKSIVEALIRQYSFEN